ncbi:MAG: hypothetical protein H6740_08555 [Alphaproteobacteria bacterium]|nr:hypothetical protein [Alphaproteobacteria bacterium]
MKVFFLAHERESAEYRDHVKVIGVYSSLEQVHAVIACLREQPGFCDCPDGFGFDEYEVDAPPCWQDGFGFGFEE